MDNRAIYHNSQDINFRKPFGAVRVDTKVELYLEASGNIQDVILYMIDFNNEIHVITMNRVYIEDKKEKYKASYIFTKVGVVVYYFSLKIDGNVIYYGNKEDLLGGEGQVYYNNPKGFQITIYEESLVPNWYKQGIIYQIFVDRFFNGNESGLVDNPKKNSFIYGRWDDNPMYIKDANGDIARWDFYGGNLKGIINKLSYLKNLGVSIIYFNPIFKASSNHKYNTCDYKKIDEMFGDEKIFKELCVKAKAKGIRIILDGVFSHTGQDSIYFNKFSTENSLGAYESKESPYYDWYRFINYPDEYECWWGIKDLPNVNELNPTYLDYIIRGEESVISKWMSFGIDGWRLDVADELPDEFIEILREKVKSKSLESVLIGEVWEDASNKVSYGVKRRYFLGKELDSVTNYPLKDGIISFLKGEISSFKFSRIVLSLKENYPKENFYSLMNILGNHDTERILTALGSKELSILALVIQMTMVGVPLIYYGDEAGLTGGKDPDNRKTFPWGKEDKKIFYMYKKLVSIRNNREELKIGDIDFIKSHEDVLIYRRVLNNRYLYIAINRNVNEEKEIELPEKSKIVYRKELITNIHIPITKGKLILKPSEGVILL